MVSGLYHGPDRWNALRPDRLGEALVIRALTDMGASGRGWLNRVLTVDSDAQLEQALDTLARIAVSGAATEPMLDAVIDQHHNLVERCQHQARGTPQQPGHTDLTTALVRLHVALLTDERVVQQPLARQTGLSASADLLGDLARDHGRSNDALTIFTGALANDERKHQLEPGNTGYQHDVSVSYNKLGDLARAEGRSGDTETLYHQALTVRERLAAGEPGNTGHQCDLSISYERLGDLAERRADLEAARTFIDLATRLRRRLQQTEPGWVEVAVELAYTIYSRRAT